MAKEILGFPLPGRLSQLIETGNWNLANETMFGVATGIPSNEIGLRFLNFDEIQTSTKSIRRLAYSDSKTFALLSPLTIHKNKLPLELLDTHKCLLIIESMNENYVVLDYRCSDEPEVRVTADDDDMLKHKLIAKNFDDFADAIGMPTSSDVS